LAIRKELINKDKLAQQKKKNDELKELERLAKKYNMELVGSGRIT